MLKFNKLFIAIILSVIAGCSSVETREEIPQVSFHSNNIHRAIRLNDIEGTKILLKNKQNLEKYGKKGITPLSEACILKNHEIVKLLIESGAQVNKQDMIGYYPIMYAASMGDNKAILKTLIENGAYINISNPKNKFTALMAATKKGHKSTVHFLLENKADVAKDAEGTTALDIAIKEKHKEIIQLLLAHGAISTKPEIKGRVYKQIPPPPKGCAMGEYDPEKGWKCFIK